MNNHKWRVAKYNENPIGLRIAHLDFYQMADGWLVFTLMDGEVMNGNV